MADTEPREITYQCARHPKVETVLRCNRCETPICPKCLVYTPVGVRCPDCGRAQPNPIYQLGSEVLLRAVGAAIVLTVVAAIAWAMVAQIWFLGFFLLIVALGIGYGIGEGISRAAKYRRGPVLMVLAGLTAAAGYLLGLVLVSFLNGWPLDAAVMIALQRAVGLWGLIALVLTVVMAGSRVR